MQMFLYQLITVPWLQCNLQNVIVYFAAIEPVTSPEFLTPQPLVGRSGNRERFRRKGVGRPRTPGGDSTDAFYTCSSADVSVNYGETPVHPPHQAVSHSDSSTPALVTAHGVIHPPDQGGGSVSVHSSSETDRLIQDQPKPGARWKKTKCGFLIFGIAAVLLLIASVVATFAVVNPSYSSTYLAYPGSQGVTVSLGTVTSLWYSSVSIEQQENTEVPRANIYVVPSSEVKRQECSASIRCTPGPIQANTRKAGPVGHIYLLEGASFNYTLCLKNYSNNATATAFIFDSNATYTEFRDCLSDGYKSSVKHQNVSIGTSEYDCTSVIFTSSHDSYYYITTEITFDNDGRTAQKIDLLCYISAHLKCFNHSGYTDLCTLTEHSKTCDIYLLGLNNLTFPWVEDYTMLALVEERSTTHFVVNVGKSWYILVLPTLGFIFISAVILVISIPVIVLYRQRHSAG